MTNSLRNSPHPERPHEPDIRSAAFMPLQLPKWQSLRMAKRHKCRAPVQGPNARPKLELAAPHEPHGGRGYNTLSPMGQSFVHCGFMVPCAIWESWKLPMNRTPKAALKPPALQTLRAGEGRPELASAFGVRAALAPLFLRRSLRARFMGSMRKHLREILSRNRCASRANPCPRWNRDLHMPVQGSDARFLKSWKLSMNLGAPASRRQGRNSPARRRRSQGSAQGLKARMFRGILSPSEGERGEGKATDSQP